MSKVTIIPVDDSSDEVLLTAKEWAELNASKSSISTQTHTAADSNQALAGAIVEAIRETGPRKFVRSGQQTINTPFNPKGKRDRKLPRPVSQNGARINHKHVTDEEIELCGQLKPGRYIERLVTITAAEDDASGELGALEITYKCKTADQRLALGSKLNGPGKTGFERMLRIIIAEQNAQEVARKAAIKADLL